MAKSFYIVEFRTAEGSFLSQTCATIRIARKRAAWYAAANWVTETIIWRGRPGCERVA